MSKLEKIEEIYHAALERPPSERGAFLAEACGADAELRREVASLLSFAEQAQDFIETPLEDLAAELLAGQNGQALIGKTLQHYRVLSALGAGGMGEVYLAEDTKLGRKCALKILPPHFSADAERHQRFEQEARAVSALNHPNILTIYAIEEAANVNFIATEFIDGQTLRERIAAGALAWPETVEIGCQIAGALESAHSVGIIHRDIKPANIMLRRDGYVKVLDFGLAKLTMQSASAGDFNTREQTGPQRVMGTINYMSPEQALGEKLDARSDIFSLGVVLYEMLTGAQPFKGPSDAAIYNATLNQTPPPLRELNAEVPPALERVISRALAKDREQRYQTADELLTELKNVGPERPPEQTSALNREDTQTPPAPVIAAAQPSRGSAKLWAGKALPHLRGVAPGALLLLAALGLGLWFFFFRNPTKPAPIASLAVLPFQNKSADADSEYLADGLAESLIYRLSQLPNLKVSPASSVFRYKGAETDVKRVAGELKVDAVLTGRIAQRGDKLTISVELIDAQNNELLWGEQYERQMSELLATQRGITSEIANKLKLKLSGETEQKLAQDYTNNNEAYQLYLKGRFLYARRKKEDILQGIGYFQQAGKLDPNFALAYVGLANCYNIMPTYAYLSTKEASPPAQAAAQKALAIDPTLAEAHAALAFALTVYDWNWVAAEREYRRALELNPNIAELHYRYGLDYLIPLGRTAEAITEIERAVELEPLSLPALASLSGAYLFAGQNERALKQAQKAFDLEPNFVGARIWLGYMYASNGMYAKATAFSEESLQVAPTSQPLLRNAGYAYAKAGRWLEARQVLDKFKETAKTQYVGSYYLAAIYTALGQRDEAFAALEKAYTEREYHLLRLKVDPFMAPLRDDPRFADLVRRMGLPLTP